ncbi:hypothetical protein GCM10010260_28060 [Streptomyces filipinensis]|uniref:Secreted protein n=1 Tax=Streptomyces filipinensis TaxID=66887 RepID=A0A918I9W3_9ACTN|nr:hypothetical protein [Streptomyces filipinensis]GGU91919.1 hypothetical protein GCM10010260_28060 [Streptomyces filipinensis]
MDDEPRRSGSGAAGAWRKAVPPPALCGFLLLLALMFTVAYAVGAAAGPVAPGLHGTGSGGAGDGGPGDGDMDMGGMHGGAGR